MSVNQNLLQRLLGEFHERLNTTVLKEATPRDAEFASVTNKIKVAIGMRRAGKTLFLYQKIRQLVDSGVSLSSILYINFEDDRLLPFDREKLAALIEAFYTLYPENHEKKCYLFLDEIQNVPQWPVVIRRFFDSKDVEIFLTGSSAKLLSKEIATSLRGRSLATEIWPYSFSEFMRAKHYENTPGLFDKKKQDCLTRYFHEYLTVGGFPEVNSYSDDIRQQTLQDYIDVVIYRDIIERYSIKNASLIKYMILSMLKCASSNFSVNKFYNDARTQGYKISKDTLYEYADYIEDAFLAFSISQYSSSHRRLQTSPKKIYAIDPGIVRAVSLAVNRDLGRLFENVVYLDLRRKGAAVHYYLTKEHYEVDFLASNLKGERELLQVVWDMSDDKTREREQRALLAAEKELNVKGRIITLDSYLQYGV